MAETNNFENMMFNYIDQFKVLLSQDTWDNILLNCTKNEMLVLLKLYRGSDINMSQIAEYLGAPLNTTTGIVSRMEKKSMVQRNRSENDKRVVTIALTETGRVQINKIIAMFITYGEKIIGSLSSEELSLMTRLIGKVITVIKETAIEEKPQAKKIRKITIE